MNEKFEIKIEDNFPNRMERQIIIETDNVTIKSDVMKSDSNECKKLALTLILTGYQLLNNHKLEDAEHD